MASRPARERPLAVAVVRQGFSRGALLSPAVCELLLVLTGWLVYALLRGAIFADPANAFERAESIIRLEQRLGIYWELQIQELALSGGQIVVDIANGFYALGHAPALGIFAVWIYRHNRRQYHIVRNTFFASLGIALVLYFLFPTAPPRLMPEHGYLDTMKLAGYAGKDGELLLNEFAAVPSLHFGWALIPAVGMWVACSQWWVRWGGLLFFVLATLWAIVATANHFFFDAMAGTLVMAAAFLIALWWDRNRESVLQNGTIFSSRRI
jgi:hypothetical protein